MNNDLEQFSEERLKDIVEFKVKPTPLDGVLLARIVLSVKQAKPIGIFNQMIFDVAGSATVFSNKEALKAGFCSENGVLAHNQQPLYTTPQPAHTYQVIKITQGMLDAAVADYCTTGKYTVENIPYELRRQVEFEAECTFKAMLAAAPKPESE